MQCNGNGACKTDGLKRNGATEKDETPPSKVRTLSMKHVMSEIRGKLIEMKKTKRLRAK